MSNNILIADSGSTKTEWCLLGGKKKKTFFTEGLSPYFLSTNQIEDKIRMELLPEMGKADIEAVYFYGTGCASKENAKIATDGIKKVFPQINVSVNTDLLGAAKSLCGDSKGIACILGTGSNSCYFNGKSIGKNNPGLGYVLGDEGSGAYLGKKVVQYFLYKSFDEELMAAFQDKFNTTKEEILNAVYKGPFPNRYLASFAPFLAENRGHFMVENILEDGLNDFFYYHIYKYTESWKYPIHFTGSIAHAFQDIIKELCSVKELELGNIYKSPMEGLVNYHSNGFAKGLK